MAIFFLCGCFCCLLCCFLVGVIPIDVLVGQTAFCILSACKLGRLGWKTTVGKHGVDMTYEKTGVKATDVSIWHDTLWVLVKPYLGNDVKLEPPVCLLLLVTWFLF